MTKKQFEHVRDCYEMYLMNRHDFCNDHDTKCRDNAKQWMHSYRFWLEQYHVSDSRTIHYINECANRQVSRVLQNVI